MVCEALKINRMTEIFRRVHHDKLDRADIAALAPQVVSIAAAGDSVARRIVGENVDGLVEMVGTVATRLKLEAPELTLTGGLITNAMEVQEMFFEKLRSVLPGCVIARDGFAPVLGAVLLAYERLVQGPPPVDFIQGASIAGLLS
jgi:N-acetylglucosamine kinase-like BadF-type ATPase